MSEITPPRRNPETQLHGLGYLRPIFSETYKDSNLNLSLITQINRAHFITGFLYTEPNSLPYYYGDGLLRVIYTPSLDKTSRVSAYIIPRSQEPIPAILPTNFFTSKILTEEFPLLFEEEETEFIIKDSSFCAKAFNRIEVLYVEKTYDWILI